MMVSQKVKNRCQRHAGLDPASSIFSKLWIPAFAGMTRVGLFAVSSNMILKSFFILILLFFSSISQLKADENHDERFMRKFEASLDYKTGDIFISENRVKLKLMDGYRFLDSADAKKILEGLWGQPYSKKISGLILPPETGPFSENAWAFVVAFDAFGHINDFESDFLNPDDLISKLKHNLATENKKRLNEDRQTIEIVDWAIKPIYDKSKHNLCWAIKYSFSNEIQNEIIYNIRVLGRNGALSINTQVSEKLFDSLKNHINNALLFAEFNPGQKYDDYDGKKEISSELKLSDLIIGEKVKEESLKETIMGNLFSYRKFIIMVIFTATYLILKNFKKNKKIT